MVTSAPLPRAGDTVDLQIFLPEAIGKQAFAYIVEFDNPDLLFSDHFQIQNAKTWVRLPVLDPATNRIQFIRRELPLQTPRGSRSTGRSILFLTAPIIPAGGLIAAFTLEALKDIPPNLPLRVTVTVTVMAPTGPVRFLKYQAVRTVRWS
ncbi:MAG: hypothetical protein O7G87_01035 [bacterium]|nr:hypothetical protein [bacterium]